MIYKKHILRSKAFEFSSKIIKFTNKLPSRQPYWVITNQLLRSSTSIGANIFEAKSAHSRRDFIKYYEISLKSAHETIYWLMLLKDEITNQQEEIKLLYNKADELAKILCSSIKTLKTKL